MGPELMEALQLLKYWVQQRGELNFTKEDEIGEQWAELEALMQELGSVTKDIRAFIASLGHDLDALHL